MVCATSFRIGLFVFLVSVVGTACGSTGDIVGAEPDTSFVGGGEVLVFTGSDERLAQIGLDGSGREQLFDGDYYVHDVSFDGTKFLLGDYDINLFLGDVASRDVQRIALLDQKTADAGFSPDGTTIAAGVISLDGTEDEDTVHLIDVESLEAETIPKSSSEFLPDLDWSQDGQSVWLSFDGLFQRIDLETRERTWEDSLPDDLWLSPVYRIVDRCPSTGQQLYLTEEGPGGLDIADPDNMEETARALVRIEGASDSVLGDPAHPISNPRFSPSCAYAVFGFSDRVWVVEVETGRVGPLAGGSSEFFLSPIPTE